MDGIITFLCLFCFPCLPSCEITGWTTRGWNSWDSKPVCRTDVERHFGWFFPSTSFTIIMQCTTCRALSATVYSQPLSFLLQLLGFSFSTCADQALLIHFLNSDFLGWSRLSTLQQTNQFLWSFLPLRHTAVQYLCFSVLIFLYHCHASITLTWYPRNVLTPIMCECGIMWNVCWRLVYQSLMGKL